MREDSVTLSPHFIHNELLRGRMEAIAPGSVPLTEASAITAKMLMNTSCQARQIRNLSGCFSEVRGFIVPAHWIMRGRVSWLFQ